MKLFKELNEMGNTIVMITHDMQVAKAAGRIVRLVDGALNGKASSMEETVKTMS